jgi:hypothetical protein
MIDIVLQARAPRRPPPARCWVASCAVPATLVPTLRIALLGSGHVSRIALPARVCAGHREGFAIRFLTPARRAAIEASLQARGRRPPDWSRTDVELA